MEDIAFVRDWEVWEEVPASLSWRVIGKAPLRGKWVDLNKGDTARPDIRCRYVAMEIASARSAELFVATPPLE
eukprot:9020422-Lingulodinium_polyedra.AAC.1